VHKELRKSEATLFCVDCDANPGGAAMCQHCVPAHGGHRTIQIRRYVYCDGAARGRRKPEASPSRHSCVRRPLRLASCPVSSSLTRTSSPPRRPTPVTPPPPAPAVVRAADIAPFVDIAGVQTYTINQAKVVFLNHRPQAKQLHAGAPDGCAVCSRALREGCTYCSLACKVEALVREGRLGPGAAGATGAAPACGSPPAADACCAAAAPCAAPAAPLCGGLDTAAFAAALAAAAPAAMDVDAAGDAPSESSDCCTCDSNAGAGGRAHPHTHAPAPGPRRSSSSGNSGAAPLGRRVSGGSSSGAWAAKRSSDSSCQSHLEWHEANGHVARRKQALPRRSPLL
jgi:hypothetical protein